MLKPILALMQRELRSMLRRVKTVILLSLMCGVVFLMTLEIWPSKEYETWFQIAQMSKGYMSMVMGISFFGACLFMPGITAPTLVIERETRTWDMLSLTLINPMGIIIAKMLSTVCVFLLMFIGMLPFLAVIFFLIGIDYVQLLICLYILFLIVMTSASLGLLASAYCNTTTRAISRSYVLMLLNLGLGYIFVMFIYSIVQMLLTQDPLVLEKIFSSMTPAYSSFSMLYLSLLNINMPAFMGSTYLVEHTIFQGVIIAVALYLTWRRVRRPVRPPIAKKKEGMRQQIIAGEPLPLPPGFKPVPDKMNPVLYREIYWGLDVKKRVYFGFVLIMLLVSSSMLFSYFKYDMEIQGALYAVISINLAMSSLFCVSNFANIFTKDDELKNLDMIKMTLISPRDIVWGKIRAGIRVLNRFLIISFCLNVIFINPFFEHSNYSWSYSRSVYMMTAGHGTIWVCGMLCIQVAALASVLCKRTTTAVVTAYAMAGMLYFGVIMFMALFTRGGISEELAIFLSPAFGLYAIPEIREFENHPFIFWGIHSAIYCGVAYMVYHITLSWYTERYKNAIGEQ